MKNALYPRHLTDDCPYCGSQHVENDHSSCDFTAAGGSIEVVCRDCGKSHHLKYRLESVTLEDDAEPPNLVEFHVGLPIQDQGANKPDDAPAALVAVVQADDGVYLMVAGYGDGASARGFGCPVIVEQYDGELRVIVWNDVNSDDCGQIIPLGEASFDNEDAGLFPRFGVRLMTPDGVIIHEHLFDDQDGSARRYAEEMVVPGRHYVQIVDRKSDEVLWDSRSDR